MATFLCKALPQISTDWPKWKIFFCDERVVPFDNDDSTFKFYRDNVFNKLPLSQDQIVTINPSLSAESAAIDYIQKMAVYFPPDDLPRFDLLLLGLGPDGHTCSLFPGHKLLNETSVWVAPITDSPKPPPARITLTLSVINNARCCVFALTGEGKAEMAKRILADKEDLPGARVQPTCGELIWLLDKDAASLL